MYLCTYVLLKVKHKIKRLMKKLLIAASLLIVSAFSFQSCLDDVNNEFSSKFVGVVDSIQYEDINDTAFNEHIVKAFSSEEMPLSGEPSIFDVKETSNVSPDRALYNCIMTAEKQYEDLLKTIDPKEINVRNEIQKYTADTLDADTLDGFVVYYGLYGYSLFSDGKWSSTAKPFSVVYPKQNYE